MPPKTRKPRYDPNAKAKERSRRACKPKSCPRCHAEILEGPSEDDMYWTARVDPALVSEWDEGLGRLQGLASYALLAHGRELKLDYRDHYARRREPRPDVVLDHVCASVSVGYEAAQSDPWSEL